MYSEHKFKLIIMIKLIFISVFSHLHGKVENFLELSSLAKKSLSQLSISHQAVVECMAPSL